MAGRKLTLTALRALDTHLQHLAGFVHRQVQQIENRAAQTTPPAFETPDSVPSRSRPEGPPAHWLERVRQVAPGFLDPDQANSGQESAQSFKFKAGDRSEEVINPSANPNLAGEENPVETKQVSTEKNKGLSGPAPKFSFRAPQQANRVEKAPSYNAKSSEDNPEDEGEAGNPEPNSKRPLSQRARIVFPGYGPERDARNSQLPQKPGNPDTSAIPASNREVNYSAGSSTREDALNRPDTQKEAEATSRNLAGYSSNLPPKIFNSPKFDDVKDFGQPLQNKLTPNYASARNSPSSQPGNSFVQGNSIPGVDYLTSRQGKNPKVNFLPVNQMQDPPEPNYPGTIENNISQTRAYKRELPNEQMPNAPEYWSYGQEVETLSGRKGRNINPFQSQVDINEGGSSNQPWPELPGELPVEAEAIDWQLVRRKMEHLRRLDEEQRGTYGAGSLFN